MASAAEILGDRWTLLILREAFYGVQRYDDMLKDLEAPRSMLTDRLRKLVDRGLMQRRPYQEPGDRMRHAYALTDAGKALAPVFIAMTQWGEEHVLKRPAPVQVVDGQTALPLRTVLVDSEDEIVSPQHAVLVKPGD